MQIKKEEIAGRILEASRTEFLMKGFQKTSMRGIADKSGVALSSIYTYYSGKDHIFKELVLPLLNEFNTMLREHNNPKYLSKDVFYSEKYHTQRIGELFNLVENYRTELKLLLLNAQGSELADYREELIDRYTEKGIEFVSVFNERYPELNNSISRFFIHNATAWWISILQEMVMHDMQEEEMKQFITEYVNFFIAGWGRLMKV
ncbi:MAG: TetR/AcrR family transcriptional regulator [Desulfobacterales bacterium]|nr:TetR/AcrR family transcriptional regulator [Desulfobacterales bacterium]